MIELNKNNKKNFWITFTMTKTCNLRCPYCCAIDRLDNTKLDNFEVRDQFIEELKRLKIVYPDYNINLNLYGGEPLLSSNLFEFIDECKKYTSYINIFSNFSMKIKEDYKIKLYEYLENKIIGTILVSIHDSANKNKLKENILMFKEFITINLLVDKGNSKDIDNKYIWMKWLIENGVKYEYSTITSGKEYVDIVFSEDNYKIDEIIKNSQNKIHLLQVDNSYICHTEFDKLGYKQAPKFFLVKCHLTLFRITFEGMIESFCAANPKILKPLSEGIDKVDVICSNNYGGCECGIELNKMLIKKK